LARETIVVPRDAVWRKASHSVGQGACVEIASLPVHTAVRDSKNLSGPALVFSRREWTLFLESVKSDLLRQASQ
jgi:hypothetical protein